MMNKTQIKVVYYGHKAGTNTVDEKGNTIIYINCYSIESVIDEITLLSLTGNNKRGFIKSIDFEIDDTEFSFHASEDKTEYLVLYRFKDKPFYPVQNTIYDSFDNAMENLLKLLKIYLKNS